MKEGDRVIIKDNLESEMRRLNFSEEACKSMAERFVGTEQEISGLYITDGCDEYATVDMCIVIPVQCLKVL